MKSLSDLIAAIPNKGDETIIAGYVARNAGYYPLPPDIQRDLRLDALKDNLDDLEAEEHFDALRRESEERAW